MSSPPPKLRKIDDNLLTRNHIESGVPHLPDDLMLMILDHLTNEERAPLGTTCKRFRELDFELGKKCFDKIAIRSKIVISGTAANTVYVVRMRWNAHSDGPIQHPYHSIRLFRKAKTTALKIEHTESVCHSTKFIAVVNFFKEIQYEKLQYESGCNQDCIDMFFNALFKGRKLDKSQIYLILTTRITNGTYREEVLRAKDSLMKLQKIDKLTLMWSTTAELPNNHIIDDDTLLHIIANVNHVVLYDIVCSPIGVTNAFEIISKSHGYKFLLFYGSKTISDDLFAMTNLRYTRHMMGDNRFLIDFPRAILIEYPSFKLEGFACVQIGKLDDRQQMIKEEVDFML